MDHGVLITYDIPPASQDFPLHEVLAILMSYSELKHCRLLASHSHLFVCFRFLFFISHFT